MQLYIFILSGLVLALVFNITSIQNSQWYSWFVGILLAIGLYGSTFGISVAEARQHAGIILRAITIGVLLKALIIGSVLSLVMQNPFGFILGIVVAQIDPLSTAALLQGNRMSTRAKTILASWAAFDDPMTVILALYAPMLVALATGVAWQPLSAMQQTGIAGYALEIGINLAFAAGVFALWTILKRFFKAPHPIAAGLAVAGGYGLLAGAISVAVFGFWMLAIALIGLFLRPPIEQTLNRAVDWALALAALLLGILLVNGVNLPAGIALGVAAYAAQIIVGFLLTKRLPSRDRWHIAFAQQNGITAIILALLFEPIYPGTISIVAPAIIVVNALHRATNGVLDSRLDQPRRTRS